MQIQTFKTADLKEYENNPRNNDAAVDAVANSIREFGFKVPIIVDDNNVIVAGHTRLRAAKQLGLDEVPCIVAGDLTEEQIKAFRLADNKTAELAEWDYEKLQKEIKDITDIDMEQFGSFTADIQDELDDAIDEYDEESKYTDKTDIPQYTPADEKPELNQCVDLDKTNRLIEEIRNADIPENEKEFLAEAAHRHSVFNYKNIAAYYAQADEKTQELMEKSALVIIDYNDAIKYGYAKIKQRIDDIREEGKND